MQRPAIQILGGYAGYMTAPIWDYALLSDMRTAVLVSRGGGVDWLCLPRIDSPAVFASLLGTEENGRWSMALVDGAVTGRAYEPGTFILHTRWRTPTGEAEVIEFMPSADGRTDLVRQVRCTAGRVSVTHDLRLRPDYGATVPWIRQLTGDDAHLSAIAGPDRYILRGPRLEASGRSHRGIFHLAAGHSHTWTLTWVPSCDDIPDELHVAEALAATRTDWLGWSSQLTDGGRWSEAVHRSLLVLRALTNVRTGGIVAAPTMGLPEDPGGVRNWDYRYCWLRDSALTLEALLLHGRTEAALRWRDWLLRAVAGDPEDLQIMYGVAGERYLPERELPHLSGYLGSTPVRVGNAAAAQYQADVIGEVLIALAKLRDAGVAEDAFSWPLQRHLLGFVVRHADRPDQGLWEMRGPARFFTHSRVMMWAALDRGVRAVEGHGLDGPVHEWASLRDRLRREIMEKGVSAGGHFTQSYGSTEVDASLLQLPQTGFVAYDDPLMLATVERIEGDLMHHGFLLRYRPEAVEDGLAGSEHPFLACSFWLVEQYAHSGRPDDAVALMDSLVGCTNDLGLLAEEYDPVQGRQLGNFPQAFSHLTLVRAADAVRAASLRSDDKQE